MILLQEGVCYEVCNSGGGLVSVFLGNMMLLKILGRRKQTRLQPCISRWPWSLPTPWILAIYTIRKRNH